MQTSIDALVRVHMHLDLLPLDAIATLGFETLQVGPDHIVLLARRHVLGELAIVIRILFPAGFLLIVVPNLYLHSVNRVVIWTPNCTEDQGIGFFVLVFRRRKIARGSGGSTEGKYRRHAQPSRHSRGSAEVQLQGVRRKRS